MKFRYAMFYNYHKLLNDQTTTKHKFITFFRPSPSRKTFYRDFFVSLRKSKSIIDWYTPDARHTAHLPKLMKVIKRISSLNIYTVSPDDDGEVRHVSYVWQCPMILHLACCSLDCSKTQVWRLNKLSPSDIGMLLHKTITDGQFGKILPVGHQKRSCRWRQLGETLVYNVSFIDSKLWKPIWVPSSSNV